MALDAELSMQDAGLSAYHQRHVTKGALGVFLAAIDEGRIPSGSVLVVEGLDRLSRAEPILAQAQLAQVVNAGITVVTASDGREYNRERLKAQPMDLVYSLLVMIRAHEESDTKSKRVRAAIHRQCRGWESGTWRGVIRNGKDPQWVRLEGTSFAVVPKRAEAVLLAIRMFREGHGSVRIIRTLAERGLQLTDGGNPAQQLYRIIRNRALVGDKVLEVDGHEYRLAGYYPPIMEQHAFDDLQHHVNQRRRRKGAGEIVGIITGQRLTYCGYCGASLSAQNLMARRRKDDGTPQDGHRRLICASYSAGAGCSVVGSCSVVPVEHAIMSYCSDQMNLSRLLEGGDQTQALAGQLSAARARAADVAAKVERITDAILAEDGAEAPAAFRRRARELEEQLASHQAEVVALERQLAAAGSAPTPAAAQAWGELVSGVRSLDYDARMKARQLIADTFDRIVVYHRGMTPSAPHAKKGTIDLLLMAKRGATRLLHIDRQTGEWRSGDDLDSTNLPLPPLLDYEKSTP